MSEEKTQDSPSKADHRPEVTKEDLRDMFAKFLKDSESDRINNQLEFSALKSAVDRLSENSSPSSTVDHLDTPPDRRTITRRSSYLFGVPSTSKFYVAPRPLRDRSTVPHPVRDTLSPPASLESPPFSRPAVQTTPSVIQVLQTEINYEHQLKVSSLEGLSYLSKQLQLLLSRHAGREIKIAHMVAIPLRQHIVSSWNAYLTKQSISTGIESPEVMVNDWLSFPNELVQEMLLEAARPRTREQYSQELIRFLIKTIPQSPDINAENFNKVYFEPLMKSLHDLLHLHDLLSADTSNFSNNASKMPPTHYGTRETPGHIQLWIISLGSQKDAILQWLGKDELQKHKTLAPAVKYIRTKLMNGKAQSEERQDFQHQLTPLKYEDIRKTQGESHQRNQTHFAPRHQPLAQSDYRSSHFKPRSTMAALVTHNDPDESFDDYPSQTSDHHDNPYNLQKDYDDEYDDPNAIDDTDQIDPRTLTDDVSTYCAINTSPSYRSAISAAFQGYCSELFVYGKCSKRDSGCIMDHSSAAQERCIHSFVLLSKREVLEHAALPPWRLPTAPAPSKLRSSNPYSDARSLRPQPPAFVQPRTYGHIASGSGNSRTASTTPRPYFK